MKGKYLVIINAVGLFASIFNTMNSVTQFEMLGWGSSSIFALSNLMNQIEINRYIKKESEDVE
jgi:hypothetical protein